MYWKISKLHNSFIVAPIEALLVSLCAAFQGLHGSINLFYGVYKGSYNGFIPEISKQMCYNSNQNKDLKCNRI